MAVGEKNFGGWLLANKELWLLAVGSWQNEEERKMRIGSRADALEMNLN